MKKTILLNGPAIYDKGGLYPAGTGGMARNMKILLEQFQSEHFNMKPVFNSVRKSKSPGAVSLVLRMVRDSFNMFRRTPGAHGAHIFGTYRTATVREFFAVLICRLFRVPVLYQIRAGYFINWYKGSGKIQRQMIHWILRHAEVVICEGRPYVDFLEELGFKAYHFPNFAPSAEIPAEVGEKLQDPVIRLVYVGYCWDQKGVFELVEGCRLAAEKDIPIALTLVGNEAPDFTAWLDEIGDQPFEFNRLGVQSHDKVLEGYGTNDVFCMPSKFFGEGHNNAINEAMMMGMVIISSKQGFLESVLGEENAWFLDEVTPEQIALALEDIHNNREEARARAKGARNRVLTRYNSNIAFSQLEKHYLELTGREN